MHQRCFTFLILSFFLRGVNAFFTGLQPIQHDFVRKNIKTHFHNYSERTVRNQKEARNKQFWRVFVTNVLRKNCGATQDPKEESSE